MKQRKSQSIFDFAVALIAVAGLIVGIVRIWVWFNANYAKRQQAYQQSRIVAARPQATYTAPVDTGFQPLDLTENWVFRGQASGTVTITGTGDVPGGATSDCDATCGVNCLEQAELTCCLQCVCNNQIQPMIQANNNQILGICGSDLNCDSCADGTGQACRLRSGADSMRDQADKCDDPWEICWWGNWGKTSGELRRAADELDATAASLEDTARKLNTRSGQMQECCAKETSALQKQCFDELKLQVCAEDCQSKAQQKINDCKTGCGTGVLSASCNSLCQIRGDIHYQFCYTSCTTTEYPPCSQRVETVAGQVNAAITDLQETRQPLQALYDEINRVVPSCNSAAQITCTNRCNTQCASGGPLGPCNVTPCPGGQVCKCLAYGNTQQLFIIDIACFNNCYSGYYNSSNEWVTGCYDTERNTCCRTGCCEGGAWDRDCDTPTANCDEECAAIYGTSCQKCGLTKLSTILNTAIGEIDGQISKFQGVVAALPGCCELGTTEAEDSCIEDKIAQVEE